MNIQKLQSKLEKIKTELARSQARLNQLNADNQKNQDEKNNISFIMPAYNCADTIEESVDSIFNGNFTDGDELIIVNRKTKKKLPIDKSFKPSSKPGWGISEKYCC